MARYILMVNCEPYFKETRYTIIMHMYGVCIKYTEHIEIIEVIDE